MAETETLDFTAKVADSTTVNEDVELLCSSGNGMSEGVAALKRCVTAEIDTSAPFESVREAVDRFGGIGFWRPNCYTNKLSDAQDAMEEFDAGNIEEQTAQLEKELVAKEEETLSVLKELKTAKLVVEELKLKVHKQAMDLRSRDEEEKENHESNVGGGFSLYPSAAPGLILLQLKQAKLNLNRATSDLSEIRASIESYTNKIEEERNDIEQTRRHLNSNSSRISSLKEELKQTRKKIQLVKDADIKGDQIKRTGEEAKSQVLQAMSEIEQTKSRIKTVELRLVAAKKMKEAAITAEAVAVAEIKALSNTETPEDLITLSSEAYSSLTSKTRKADEISKIKVIDAMDQVDEANASNMEILQHVEEATREVRASKKALEEALHKVVIVNKEKLFAEDALRKRRRSEHGRRRRIVQNSSKFKNSCRKDGLNPVKTNESAVHVLQPTLSIGQILSRKLLQLEGHDDTEMERDQIPEIKDTVSLGQMLGKENGEVPRLKNSEKENASKEQIHAKRKKFGFAPFAGLLRQKSKKKKRISSIYRPCSTSGFKIMGA